MVQCIQFSPDPFSFQYVDVNNLVSNNVSLSSDTSFWDILTNPDSYTHKKGKILGKIPLPISLFTYYSLKINFVPFLKS